jgi:GNAT superfamily N-acetyltransferase
MRNLIVQEVKSRKDMKRFVKYGNRLYAACPYYVPDLEMDLRETFNPKKNPALAYSDVKLFTARSDDGMVGRVCAFINHHTNERWKTRCVRFQMLDFVDDPEVSEALLHAVEEWGRSQGMDTVEGPMGFTDFDKEGMLVEDFDLMGSMNTYYNYDYYPRHLERLGYKKAVDWVQLRIEVPEELPTRFSRTAKLVHEHFHLKVTTMTRRQIIDEGYGEKVFQLLNEAYAPLFGFTEIDPKQAAQFVGLYIRLVDLRLVPIVLNERGELVGVAVCLMSLSQALRKAEGRLFPFGWYHLLKAMKWKHSDTAELLLIAVRPDYQGMGVNALFFEYLLPQFKALGLKHAETGPQLEDNTKELSQWNMFDTKTVKRRRCYTKRIADSSPITEEGK